MRAEGSSLSPNASGSKIRQCLFIADPNPNIILLLKMAKPHEKKGKDSKYQAMESENDRDREGVTQAYAWGFCFLFDSEGEFLAKDVTVSNFRPLHPPLSEEVLSEAFERDMEKKENVKFIRGQFDAYVTPFDRSYNVIVPTFRPNAEPVVERKRSIDKPKEEVAPFPKEASPAIEIPISRARSKTMDLAQSKGSDVIGTSLPDSGIPSRNSVDVVQKMDRRFSRDEGAKKKKKSRDSPSHDSIQRDYTKLKTIHSLTSYFPQLSFVNVLLFYPESLTMKSTSSVMVRRGGEETFYFL